MIIYGELNDFWSVAMQSEVKVNRIICGKSEDKLKDFPENLFDGVVTDPPYELGFMGKKWDSSGIAYSVKLWKEVLRVTKPGGHLLCFGSTRTHHRVACAIEDAGWIIRDEIDWLYGSGFPKSRDISKGIDKEAGVERKVIGTQKGSRGAEGTGYENSVPHTANIPKVIIDIPITAPATELAKQYDGYGTTLKPAREPITVAMKPLEKGLTFAQNAEKWGVAGFNIDGGRINGKRWPANIILSHAPNCICIKEDIWACVSCCPLRMLDTQSGVSTIARGSRVQVGKGIFNKTNLVYGHGSDEQCVGINYGDCGGASRFFYCAKPSRSEKEAGLKGLVECMDCGKFDSDTHTIIDNGKSMKVKCVRNTHVTVKPLNLMKYLINLISPPKSKLVLLDPFCGSGSTLVAAHSLGMNYIGIDQDLENVLIATARSEFEEVLEEEDIEEVRTIDQEASDLCEAGLNLSSAEIEALI